MLYVYWFKELSNLFCLCLSEEKSTLKIAIREGWILMVLGHLQPNFECRLYNYYIRGPDRQTEVETYLNRVVKLFSSCASTSG